ncbi:MAG TPA: hypothetical protein VK610_02080 [Rhodothermales bacterium]|nr:hypothetical protein [Rhodothermales bacterium]
MTALLAVDLFPGASHAPATSALRHPGLSIVFLDATSADFVVAVESAEPEDVASVIERLALRPGVAGVFLYPT